MSAVQDLKQRRATLSQQIAEIDAVLRQLGAVWQARSRNRGGAVDAAKSQAAKDAWAKRRAQSAPAKPAKPAPRLRVRTPQQRQRNAAHPTQQVSKPASLAAAATSD